MTTRRELSEAALRRYEAARRAKETEQAMTDAHAKFAATRAAHTAALGELRTATTAHAAMEQQLIDHELAGSDET